jgi:hypothetical protein
MKWLETMLGISPDSGNGATEAVLVLGLALVVGAALAARRRFFDKWRTK